MPAGRPEGITAPSMRCPSKDAASDTQRPLGGAGDGCCASAVATTRAVARARARRAGMLAGRRKVTITRGFGVDT